MAGARKENRGRGSNETKFSLSVASFSATLCPPPALEPGTPPADSHHSTSFPEQSRSHQGPVGESEERNVSLWRGRKQWMGRGEGATYDASVMKPFFRAGFVLCMEAGEREEVRKGREREGTGETE